MEKVFIWLYSFFEKRRTLFWIVMSGSFLLCGWLATRLKFEEDIAKMLPKDRKLEKLNAIIQNSKFSDKLVLLVAFKDSTKPPDPDSLVAYADRFSTALRKRSAPLIDQLRDKVGDTLAMELFSTVSTHLPSFLEERDFQSLDSLTRPEQIARNLEKDFNLLTSPAGIAMKKMISSDPLGISLLAMRKLRQVDDNFELYDSYVITKDKRQVLMFLTPAFPANNTWENAQLLNSINAVADSLDFSSGGNITVSYFGAAAVSVGNALQLRRDTLVTQGITVVFLVLFIGLYFRRKLAPVIILVPVLFGCLFALAAIYLVKGSISVIALGCGSIVLGVAVNYSLHLFNHRRYTHSMQEVIRDLTLPLTVGSLTTIGGFLCLEFVGSVMLRDLGLFAAFSLIGASLASLVFLPHLVASGKSIEKAAFARPTLIERLAAYRPELSKLFIAIIVLLTIVFAYTARWVGFESDLSQINYMPAKLKEAERRLNSMNVLSGQSVYLLSEGRDLDQALALNEQASEKASQLAGRGLVNKMNGVYPFVISDSLQARRINRWNSYWTSEKKAEVLSALREKAAILKFSPTAFEDFSQHLLTSFSPLDKPARNWLISHFTDDYVSQSPSGSMVVTLLRVPKGKRDSVYQAFGDLPQVSLVDRQLFTDQFIQMINNDFASIAWMSSILVFSVLLLTYGRIELTLISFIPMVITFIWILGIMGLLGIKFNIINIIISAFIFGLGDDYSLFIMDGLLQEYKSGRKNLVSYKSSIILSAITTLAGLGVLIFAKHPALRSIAVISMVGISCVVVMSQILIPFLFRILITKRTSSGKYPWTLSGFLKTAFAFSYFTIGSLILTLAGFILVKLNPFRKETGKYWYHWLICQFSKSLIYIMINVKKQIINPDRENFSKPAVVIANHQSFLDILSAIMLHPKLILFTNHWVWNSPVFGWVVRMADYYPIMMGMEANLDQLEDRVRNGYSIVVFPEGTRSADGTIKRFHKGAFYLAEKLKLDILPLLIHGTGYTMTKGDFLLKDGKITIKFLPRIQGNTGYAQQAKSIGRYFRKEYETLRSNLEQPGYFREQLIYNYIYKGPVLEWYLRVKLSLEKNYANIHDQLPLSGKILDLGCGYGFVSYMMHFASPERTITGIDIDDEKIAVARHCFSRNGMLQFNCRDVNEFQFEECDAILLSDVLHYLSHEDQEQLLDKCLSNLRPGGVLVIRDANKDLVEKHKRTQLTEFFSTKLTSFNKTNGKGLSFFSPRLIQRMAALKNMDYLEKQDSKFTSNHLYVIRNKSAVQHGSI